MPRIHLVLRRDNSVETWNCHLPAKVGPPAPQAWRRGPTEKQELLDAIGQWKGRTIVSTFADSAHAQTEPLFMIHSHVVNLQFANEIMAMDDTFSTSHLGVPCHIIIEDWEAWD
jgi:hypothetical protein